MDFVNVQKSSKGKKILNKLHGETLNYGNFQHKNNIQETREEEK